MSKLLCTALKVFATNRATTAVGKTLKTGTHVSISKLPNGGLAKTVRKVNGDVIKSHLTADGKFVTGISQKTGRGTIDISYGAQNYDKVIQVQPKIGGYFNFLGHTDRANGILYSNISGKYGASEKHMPLFKQAIEYIRKGNIKYLCNMMKMNNI